MFDEKTSSSCLNAVDKIFFCKFRGYTQQAYHRNHKWLRVGINSVSNISDSIKPLPQNLCLKTLESYTYL